MTEGLALALPIVMTISALLAVVCDFEAKTIGVSEERSPVVGGVLKIQLRLGRLDAERAQAGSDGSNVGRRVAKRPT